jgi:hypothetical protein
MSRRILNVVPANGSGYCRPDDRLRRGPISSVPAMRKVSATRGSSVSNHNRRWLWVPALAGTTGDVYDNRMSSRRRPSVLSNFFTALDATTSPSFA